MDILLYILAFFAAALAGIVNAFAGNGSSITLYLLLDVFGLPATAANATNRLGIFSGGLIALPRLQKSNLLFQARSLYIYVSLIVGALLGSFLALAVDAALFREIFKYLLLLSFFFLLIKPQRWLRSQSDSSYSWPLWLSVPLFFLLGVYGGFIQLGMGLYFLMLMVLGLRYNLVEANAIKIASVTIYTGLILPLFIWQGHVYWLLGLLFASGQACGGYLAVRMLTGQVERASLWSYRILVVVIIVALLRLFGLFEWF